MFFFFTCLSTSEYPRVGYPRCFLVILFPFLHTQELDLSAFYPVGFVLPCASVCPVYTRFNHRVPNPFLSIGVLIKKKKSPPTPSLPLCRVWYSLCLGPTVFTHRTLSPLDQRSIPREFHLKGEGLLFFFLTKIRTFPSWIAQPLGTLRVQWLISETKLSSQELFPNKSTRRGRGRVESGR